MYDYLSNLFLTHTALQAVVVILIIVAIGSTLGRVRVGGISLGATFVFFTGIVAGHIGLSINPQMLKFAENFGLIIFVYSLGLQVGPGFFNTFRKGGLKLNRLSVAVILIGTCLALGLASLTGVSIPDMVGILCGAVTNTPALAAEQQTLSQMGLPTSSPALACAVTYPLGVVGVIFAIIMLRKLFVKTSVSSAQESEDEDDTYIAEFDILNPDIIGKSIMEVAHSYRQHFVISRIWRAGVVSIPTSGTRLEKDDRVLVISNNAEIKDLAGIFGKLEDKDWNRSNIDWNSIDSQLISRRIMVTKPGINGRSIGALRFRNKYGVNITRVYRTGFMLLATPDLVLRTGDTLIVVGSKDGVSKVEEALGNAVRSLSEPNLVSICMGIVCGLALGSVPIFIPGMSTPLKLGLAGGPIIAGILIGAFGPRVHMITYTTESASLMLRRLGLAMYLACLGLDAGPQFFDTVCRPEGLMWVGLGFVITVVPVFLVGWYALKVYKLDFAAVCGMLCGSMANPMAMSYSADALHSGRPAVVYTTVYPLGIFLRVIIAQLIVVLLV